MKEVRLEAMWSGPRIYRYDGGRGGGKKGCYHREAKKKDRGKKARAKG